MSQVDKILVRLDKVSKPFLTKSGTSYRACCPAHSDKTPSLVVTEKADGVILIHCFSGCVVSDIVEAVGLQLDDLYPTRKLTTGYRPTTGHDYRALCGTASDLLLQSLLLMRSGKSIDEIGVEIMQYAARLEDIKEYLRRAA